MERQAARKLLIHSFKLLGAKTNILEELMGVNKKKTKKKSKESNIIKTETFVCSVCGKQFKNRAGLSSHLLTLHNDEKRTCDACGKVCKTQAGLKSHELIHTDASRVECECCDKTFASTDGLIMHMRWHMGETRMETIQKLHCEHCGNSYLGRRKLDIHMMQCHDAVDCPVCLKSFEDNKDVREHFQSHEMKITKKQDKKPKSCSKCGETFTTLNLLAKHKNRNHANVAPADGDTKCKHCGKGFSSPQALKHHTIVIHTQEYPEMCEDCGKKFTGTGLGETLKKHRAKCLQFLANV